MQLTRNLLPALGVSALFLGMLFAPAPADASRTCNAERRACRQSAQWIFMGCKAQCRGDFQGDPAGREACYLDCKDTRAAARPGCNDLRTACRATVSASGDPKCANGCAPDFRQCVRGARVTGRGALALCRVTARSGNQSCKVPNGPPDKDCRALVRQQLGVCLNDAGILASGQVASCIVLAETCVGTSCP